MSKVDEWKNTIVNEDCIKAMKELPEDSVDLVIADPPYNLSKGSDISWEDEVDLDGFGGEWNKTMEHWDDMTPAEYFQFTKAWLKEAKRILKPTGSIWTFGSYHNMGFLNVTYQMLEIEILNEVIWYKRNAFPNLHGTRFTASHETLLWGHVGDEDNREYTFNYEDMKKIGFPEDNLNEEGKQVRTVWDIPNNKSKIETEYGNHPTQKPLRVLERLILSSSKEGDIVLDPFCGSGSTCLSAKLNDRNYIGIEVKEEYVKLARENLENISEKPSSLEKTSKEQTNLSDNV